MASGGGAAAERRALADPDGGLAGEAGLNRPEVPAATARLGMVARFAIAAPLAGFDILACQ